MKNNKILAICLGISFIFSGSFCVFAKKKKEKTITGTFNYFFNDGTMDKDFYRKTYCGDIDDNKTNANHAMALSLWAYMRIKKLEEQGFEMDEKTRQRFLDEFYWMFLAPDYPEERIVTRGKYTFLEEEKDYGIVRKIISIKDVGEVTEKDFNIAKKKLIERIFKIIRLHREASKKIVIVPEFFKKTVEGYFVYKDNFKELCEDAGLKKYIVVHDEEKKKGVINEKTIKILFRYIEEIEKTTFENVKNAYDAFEWVGYLEDAKIFDV